MNRQSPLWNYLMSQYELSRARHRIEWLKSEVEYYSDDDLSQGQRYADLARFSTLLCDFESARDFAKKALECKHGTTEGWFWYAQFFENKFLEGTAIYDNNSSLEEVLIGYSRMNDSFGYFSLGDFFDKIEAKNEAIKWYLKAVMAKSDDNYVDKSKNRLTVLLLE